MQREFFGTSERRGSEVDPKVENVVFIGNTVYHGLNGAKRHARGCAARSGRHSGVGTVRATFYN
jgi:hypothetical protein